jgi:hypothetical protein
VPDEAKKPKNDEDNYNGPEHGIVFPLSLFERRIWTESREAIKQKVDHGGKC